MQKDDLAYVAHMLDTAEKAVQKVAASIGPPTTRTRICDWLWRI